MLEIFIKGIIIGISVAAPVGPLGLLCIDRTLKGGIKRGFVVGFGIATADLIYGTIAALGLSAISGFLLNYEKILKILGSIFLLYLAYGIIKSSKSIKKFKIKEKSLFKEFITSFLLTITNPVTIMAFLAIFTSLSGTKSSFIIVGGVFLGSMLWWLFLSTTIHFFSKKLNDKIFSKINIVSGIILVAFAFYSIFEVVFLGR